MKVKDEEKIEQRRLEILEVAKHIIMQEGIEALSIRKIASQLHQTPGIMYHYFENKDAILFEIVKEGYGDILRVIKEASSVSNDPSVQLASVLHAYIYAMYQNATLYSILMHAKHPILRQQTSILKEDICEQHETMKRLSMCLQQGIEQGIFIDMDTQLQSQVIWCTMFGVLDRCIKEQPSVELMKCISEQFIKSVLRSIRR